MIIKKLTNKYVIGPVMGILLGAGILIGCTNDSESESSSGESAGEHNGSGGESGGEHGGGESGGGEEGSAAMLAPDATFDQTRNGARLTMGYDPASNAFTGTVAKRLSQVVTDTVSLRNVRPIINYAGQDAEERGSDDSILDETIRRLITDENLTIAEAYEDTVQIMVETDQLQRSADNMIKGFSRLLVRTRNDAERLAVLEVAEHLSTELGRLIAENEP